MRLTVQKTYKMFVNGQFPRTESGRSLEVKDAKGKFLANVCWGSRKDVREAAVAARKAFGGWQKKTAYLRGQILYRMAEMLERRNAEFITELMAMSGKTRVQADQEVAKSIDRLVWYAGWADKFTQQFGCVNPVAGSFFNFSVPEPTGVVGIVAPERPALLGIVSTIAPVILTGNTCVVIASQKHPLCAVSLGEVLVTSDLPAGVVNIITGKASELVPTLSKHMDVNAVVDYRSDMATFKASAVEGADSVKRVIGHLNITEKSWYDDKKCQNPYWIQEVTEIKTAWHPIGV
ncbi:MAG: aldehyde dehydrogenase [Deltaproteobacteria bacterium CG11_big_fil_rev_8_21_14_0_20_47_16]|nr:MAG: aldehyde dehydrogenase [Deltaproteobacteria bacterium CG11_big_fil_rev_8_21_14_0_20_47_16]